ncbi:unnamed protein product [Boreogadus saida]
MSYFSCTVEITNSSTTILMNPEQFLPSGQCSVPLSPLLRPGSSGSASFTGPAGDDLDCQFTYNLPAKVAALAVWFKVPSERSNGSNNYQVALFDPRSCDKKDLLQRMGKGSENDTPSTSRYGLVVRATMSDTANAVLKVDVSDLSLYDDKEEK